MLNIAWINDFKTEEFIGGNSKTAKILISQGRKVGYGINELNPKDLEDVKEIDHIIAHYDILILNNINNFKTEVIEYIIKNCDYVKYEHDYCYCQFRNGCVNCKPSCKPAKIFYDLFRNSKLNIFFSPLQLNIYKEAFGGMLFRDAIFIPAPMDNKFYHDKSVQKKDHYLFVGAIKYGKGVSQVLDYADSQKGTGKVFHFVGKDVNKELVDRIKKDYAYIGEKRIEEMPDLYRKYEYCVFNPQIPESFSHTLMEALASGCKIIKFEKSLKTGLESYNLSPKQMLERCKNAPQQFWENIKKVIKDEK